ncbi:MAG: hypothetical protein ACRD0B_11470, partial [Acidimicrobiales bacterium]
MSLTTAESPIPRPEEQHFGTFDAAGTYVPAQITDDDLGDMSLADAIDATIVEFDDGDIVTGTVVKI